jgi:arylsulfatase A-like enzyme
LGALLTCLAACGNGAVGPSPDLILVTVDTLRTDRLGFAGYAAASTPTLDALAARGTWFENATTPMPRTTPALASLFTGLWPHHHGSREVYEPMKPLPSLASLLALRGWETVAVSASLALSKKENIDIGFGRFESGRMKAEEATRLALSFVDEVPADEPLFLWVHYWDPHTPYGNDEDDCRIPAAEMGYNAPHVSANRNGVGEALLGTCSRDYDASIAYTDAQIGALFEGLQRAGRLDGALVVFTADHGENLGEANLFFDHGPSVSDASMRVPLVFAGPGVAAGTDRGAASLEDVMPTLLSMLSVPETIRPSMDGTDLSARFEGDCLYGCGGDEVAFAEGASALHVEWHDYVRSGRVGGPECANARVYSLCSRPGSDRLTLHDRRTDPLLEHDLSAERPKVRARLEGVYERWPVEEARERTVRGERFKLVEYPLPDGKRRRALYDLRQDPLETVDVSAEHRDVARRLGTALDRWTAELDATVPLEEPQERSEDVLERLRALGYAE